MEPNLFCYEGRKRSNPHAVKLCLSDEDRQKFCNLDRGNSRESAVVTDVPTGKQWKVKRAACGLGCFCAAAATRV